MKAEFKFLKEKFSDPINAIVIAGKVFTNHSADIVNDIIDVPHAFKDDKDFYRGGKDIGDIVGFIILEAHDGAFLQ